jgi:hypothetical protein
MEGLCPTKGQGFYLEIGKEHPPYTKKEIH